ncbi:MAG: aldehyde dehydrogenase family protein [Acetobacteraceae bacterium]
MADTGLAPPSVWSGKLYSDGWRHGQGGTLAVTDKASGERLGEIGRASVKDVANAAAIAHESQRSWAALPGPHRGDIVRKAAQLVLDHTAEIAAQIVRETGSIRPKGRAEAALTAREVLEAAALASQPTGFITASEAPGRRSIARRVPVGVVGVITPWNSPFLLAARAVAPALATGNAVLLKPDPQSPVCGGAFFAQLFEAAGLPPGLLHVLPGEAEVGEALVKDAHVDMISFTGSTRVGRTIGATAGALLKRVSLELGGNNAFIVLEDADIEAAASAGAWGSFFHQGQICFTAGRHLVHERIAEGYLKALTRHAQALKVGNPATSEVHLGPLINERQAANVDRVIAETTARGARLVTGGTREGLFFAPTVLTGVAPGMAAFDEEIFGPVAPVTTFRDDAEAIRLANQTEYGLAASILSADLTRAQHIADQLRCGIIHINDQTILHEVYGPIGGHGASGNGYSYSTLTNAEQFTEWQWITSREQIATYPF